MMTIFHQFVTFDGCGNEFNDCDGFGSEDDFLAFIISVTTCARVFVCVFVCEIIMESLNNQNHFCWSVEYVRVL